MWGCACSDSAPKPAPVSSGEERLERCLRQGVHTGSDHRMTHWKVERSMKSKLINGHLNLKPTGAAGATESVEAIVLPGIPIRVVEITV